MVRKAALAALLALSLALPALADGTVTGYHFGTDPNRTLLAFESETSIETIHGVSHGLKGKVEFDFDKGEGAVQFKVPVRTLDTGIAARNEHLYSAGWLDADKHPEIVFKSNALKRTATNEKTGQETWSYDGEMTIHGVTKALKGEATVQKIPEELGKNLGRGKWVKVKAAFKITLKDFDIVVPDSSAAKVAPEWDCKIDIFGTTEAPKAEKSKEETPKTETPKEEAK